MVSFQNLIPMRDVEHASFTMGQKRVMTSEEMRVGVVWNF
jgi:hypothetical protein